MRRLEGLPVPERKESVTSARPRNRRKFVGTWRKFGKIGTIDQGKLSEVANLDLAGDEMKDSAGDLRRDDQRGSTARRLGRRSLG